MGKASPSQGRGKVSLPGREEGREGGVARGCGRPVAELRGAVAAAASPACSSVRPGAAGAPAEGAVRPLRRPRGDSAPSCRRLGPPAGEGLPASHSVFLLGAQLHGESAHARRPAGCPPVHPLARRPPPQSAPSLVSTASLQPALGSGHAVLPVPRRVPRRDLREYPALPAPPGPRRPQLGSRSPPRAPRRSPAFVCGAARGRGAPPSLKPAGRHGPRAHASRPQGQTPPAGMGV